MEDLEAFDRLDEIFHAGGSDKPDVGRLGAEEARGVNKEAATAAVLEVSIKHRLAGSGNGLHHLIPAVHLVNDVAVNRSSLISLEELGGLLGTIGHGVDELHPFAFAGEFVLNPLHVRSEIEALVRPIGPGLLLLMKRIDDPYF